MFKNINFKENFNLPIDNSIGEYSSNNIYFSGGGGGDMLSKNGLGGGGYFGRKDGLPNSGGGGFTLIGWKILIQGVVGLLWLVRRW